ncbi:MAG TPA: methyltransferase domain-containing protein [Candidatus Bathyarchaeia archaeon]|nr:methyltransferase domain-containing protein [Candidatus Bathyarchaeia archaeon]
MDRQSAHFEKKEPFLENILCALRFRKIKKHIPVDSKVLDVGCGYNGKILYKIKDKLRAGVGLDISTNGADPDKKIRLAEHDLACPLPFDDSSFDAVTSLANLEHLESPSDVLQEIHRVLKPGGILLLTAPSFFGKPVLKFLAFLRMVSQQEIDDHKNYFNKKILLGLCRQVGFTTAKHKYFQLGMNNFLIAKK